MSIRYCKRFFPLFLGLLLWQALAAYGNSWRDIYVDNAFKGEEKGTLEAPFKSVQKALADSLEKCSNFSSDVIWIKGTGEDYYGPIEVPNRNAILFRGYGDLVPEITVTGLVASSTFKSGDNYLSPLYACLPPAQVGLKDLIVRNESEAKGGPYYGADIQAFVSWEASVTNNPARMRFGIENCRFVSSFSNGCLRLRDLDQRHKPELVAAGHWSLVRNCRFEGEETLVTLASQQRALLTSNVFLGGKRALYFEGYTNSVYQRLTENIRVERNRFYGQKETAVFCGIYPGLTISNNTFYAESGTSLSFLQDNMEPRGEVIVEGNIFAGGANSRQFFAYSWEDMACCGENLFDQAESWGEAPIIGQAMFISLNPESSDFLRPGAESEAQREGHYLGALEPLPEPCAIFLLVLFLPFACRKASL